MYQFLSIPHQTKTKSLKKKLSPKYRRLTHTTTKLFKAVSPFDAASLVSPLRTVSAVILSACRRFASVGNNAKEP
jgi:hypothetical protein